jgi:hypothetical protein
MEITVEGWRAGRDERSEAARVPASNLPELTDAQKRVAKRMGISEEEYARSTYAGRLNQGRLIEKAKRFASVLRSKLESKIPGARIDRVRLLTLEHEYRIDISLEDKKAIFRVTEDMVDDFMERGFANVGESIERNLETAIAAQVTQAV